ncbi:MAG: CoA-binding protein [Dehalococcoidia bacterium]
MQESVHPLDAIFRPRSIAVVGVSSSAPTTPGMTGYGFLTAIRRQGFTGPIYPVNPKMTEVAGLRCYPSVRDIPEEVDHVISSVPAPAVPGLVDDAIARGVRSIHFYTAGFSETGDAERTDMERAAIAKLKAAGIRVIGPNCMGLYVPSVGLTFGLDMPRQSGDVAFVSQSGANAGDFVRLAAARGVRFSKVVSYGNAADLNECDFYEYAAADPQTRAVFGYLEGVRDGRRFVRVLRAAARRKPVVILKGGRTASGARAAASHTGSLAGSLAVFDALCRQAGALRVESMDELVDLAVAFQYLTPPAGRGVAVIGAGGGTSVLAADALDSFGLDVPPMPAAIQEEMRRYVPIAGSSIRNPLDLSFGISEQHFVTTVRLAAAPDDIHMLLYHTHLDFAGPGGPSARGRETIQGLLAARTVVSKPIAVAVRTPIDGRSGEYTAEFIEACRREGIGVFLGLQDAARALAALVRWRELRQDRE